MSPQAPKVSIVIAAYSPGEAITRVIDSLDVQSMPQDEFEVIFVDDGSPDDTYAQLQAIAATRPNTQVHRIENSGWPSRPRNVGIGLARGEYVMFMDHDDSLYPDALRRAYEFAHENNADVLSPKESRSNDVWWGMGALRDGNVVNACTEEGAGGGIDRLTPMVPHKLYRRQLLLDHDIRFPDGARALWEDQFVNVAAYRHASVVSVCADTPFYLWHASSTNTTHTFDPAREDFWERLADLMKFIDDTLDTPQYHDAKVTMLAHQVRGRVLDRLVLLLGKGEAKAQRMAMTHAQALLERYTSPEVYDSLKSKKHQAQVHLLRRGDAGLLRELHAVDLASTAEVNVVSASWEAGRLRMTTRSTWHAKSSARPFLAQNGDRVNILMGDKLRRALPPELVDVTDDLHRPVLALGVRSRTNHVTWAIPYERLDSRFVHDASGNLMLVSEGVAYFDPIHGAVGGAPENNVWDLRQRTEWIGRVRKAAVNYDGATRAALVDGRAAVAYSTAKKGLSIDLAQQLRTVAIDARPAQGSAGPARNWSIALENVYVHGETSLVADMLFAIATDRIPREGSDADQAAALNALASEGQLGAVINAGGGSARLSGAADLPPGSYTIYARRGGKLYPTRRTLRVASDRGVHFA